MLICGITALVMSCVALLILDAYYKKTLNRTLGRAEVNGVAYSFSGVADQGVGYPMEDQGDYNVFNFWFFRLKLPLVWYEVRYSSSSGSGQALFVQRKVFCSTFPVAVDVAYVPGFQPVSTAMIDHGHARAGASTDP